VRRVCYYHAGCPDGFGAAWAVWRAWGPSGRFVARGHSDALDAFSHQGDQVVFVDIAPTVEQAVELGEVAQQLVVLDHHLTARDRFADDPRLLPSLADRGHQVRFDLSHSGAVLAWQHFHGEEPVPSLLAYVEDQDLWRWKLPESGAINAVRATSSPGTPSRGARRRTWPARALRCCARSRSRCSAGCTLRTR
jgi:oligoribonuclease NrnB/cAMP/cGMP phosphodiesterase (DHH superfamily)